MIVSIQEDRCFGCMVPQVHPECTLVGFCTNDEIPSHTKQLTLSNIIRSCRLSYFRHLSHADPWQDHHRSLPQTYGNLTITGLSAKSAGTNKAKS